MLHYATFGDDGDGTVLLHLSEPGSGGSPAAQAPMFITLEPRPKRLSQQMAPANDAGQAQPGRRRRIFPRDRERKAPDGRQSDGCSE